MPPLLQSMKQLLLGPVFLTTLII